MPPPKMYNHHSFALVAMVVVIILVSSRSHCTKLEDSTHDKGDEDFHHVLLFTDEDIPIVEIDLTAQSTANLYHGGSECKINLRVMTRYGTLKRGINLIKADEPFPNANISYYPNPDYFGEDSFSYFMLCDDTSSSHYLWVYIIVRPRDDPIRPKDMTLSVDSYGPVHIPVVNQAHSDSDDPGLCMISRDSANSRPGGRYDEVVFRDVAPQLGMTAAQAMISTSPNCLFDNWDLKYQRWIKGSFCMIDTLFGAAAAGDFDSDGNLDVYYARVDGEDQLWRNLGNGSFEMVTHEANLSQTVRHHSSAVIWIDIDNDGDVDIYIGTSGDPRHYLYVNDGMGHFSEEAESRGLDLRPKLSPFQTSCLSLSLGDFNNDGWLDIYTTNWVVHLHQTFDYNNVTHSGTKLFKNLGAEGRPGYFEDITGAANLGRTPVPEIPVSMFDFRPYNLDIHGSFAKIAPGPYQMSATFADIDDDGFQDLLIAGDFKTSRLYWNNGNGTFTDGTEDAHVGTDENGMGTTVADYDLDGRQDWFVTSIHNKRSPEAQPKDSKRKTTDDPNFQKTGYIFGTTGNRLFKYEGDRRFSDRTDEAKVREGSWAWGAAFVDFDNDGDLDIIHTNGWDDPETTDTDFFNNVPNILYENKYTESGEATFESVGEKRGVDDRRDGRGLFLFDYDNDGDQDVFIVNIWDKPILYQNENGNQRDWVRVKVLECCVHRESLGAKVYLYSPRLKRDIIREVRSVSSFAGQGEHVAHFGLGWERDSEFTIRIHWPVTNNTRIIRKVPRRSFLQVKDIKGVRNAVETTMHLMKWVSDCAHVNVEAVVTAPHHGHVIAQSMFVTYQVKPGYVGEDSFTYSLSNGKSTEVGTVYLQIQPSEEMRSSERKETSDESNTYASYSGEDNNQEHSDWGKAFTALHRLVPPAYPDGYQSLAGQRRSNPRKISNILCQQNSDVLSADDLNEMHVHLGQLIAHDTDFSTPFANVLATENVAIEVPAGDPHFDPFSTGEQLMRFRRSARIPNSGDMKGFPREQMNKVSAYLDLSTIYGSDKERAASLRSGHHGKLKLSADGNLPFNLDHIANLNLLGGPRERLVVSGDPRVNVQPGLIALHTLFAREHNRVCDEMSAHNFMKEADDETLYQTARTITRSKWQAIVWYEFLPTVIGIDEFLRLGTYPGYNKSVEVQILNEYATAAFRYGHSQVGNIMYRFDGDWQAVKEGHLSLRDCYFNPGRILNEGGIEPVIRGMLMKQAQEVDTLFVDGVRNFLFGTNTQGLDLVSYGIQRGREHGIADYNTVRKALGLARRSSFEDITPDEVVREKLQFLYESVDDVDLWMGGLAEPHVKGGCVGQTFARIIARQFEILRSGDRFWFENSDMKTLAGRLRGYAETRLGDIVKWNTAIDWPGSVLHAHPWKRYDGGN